MTKNKSEKRTMLWPGVFAAAIALILILCVAHVLGNRRPAVEVVKGTVSQQAEYEKDFKIDGAKFDNPKVIVNPYKIAPLTALVMFKTDAEVAPKVTIPSETGDIEFEFNAAREHYLPIYGLFADTANKVVLSYEQDGQRHEKELEIKTEALAPNVMEPDEVMADKDFLGNAFYYLAPSGAVAPAIYDTDGNVRWYLTQLGTWENSRLANGHFIISSNRLVNTPYYTSGLYEMDLLGKVYNEWSLPGGYHHDYFEMENGNLMVASNNFDETNDTVEDYVVELDRKTGEIVKSWDIKKVLPHEDLGNEGYSSDDWFHNNSVWYDQVSNSIVLSGRHRDAVIAINYDDGSLEWIIGDKTGWPEEYDKYFFTPVGDDFEWQWMQHAAKVTPEGYITILDNGNNKSRNKDEWVPAEDSYTRGVVYEINTDNMTIRQVYEYGKERGSEFYSPFISDFDYLEEDHYLVHSGGISYIDGQIQNLPSTIVGAKDTHSTTVEVVDDEEVFEMHMPGNFYRAEKFELYNESDKDGLKLGKANRLGSLGRTVVAETKDGKPEAIKIDDNYTKHEISFEDEEDRLALKGVFKKHSNVRIVLNKGGKSQYYKIRVTNEAHAAMCVSAFTEEENANEEDIHVHRFVNKEGLDKGRYHVYLEIYDKIYDTEQDLVVE